MDSYLDIQVLPDPEFGENMLMAALMAKLHRALGEINRADIGVSFPRHTVTPGDKLRLHGTAVALNELEATGWRKGLKDYCDCTCITEIPAEVQWRTVSRLQTKSSPQRLMRRSVRKGWITQDEADRRVTEMKTQRVNLPYLSVRSLSSQQHFRLFIYHGEIVDTPVLGTFSSYGLSPTTTIPWF